VSTWLGVAKVLFSSQCFCHLASMSANGYPPVRVPASAVSVATSAAARAVVRSARPEVSPELEAYAAARAADERATKGTRDHAAARRRPAAMSGEAMARRDAFPGAR